METQSYPDQTFSDSVALVAWLFLTIPQQNNSLSEEYMITINLANGFVPLLIALGGLMIGAALMLYYAYKWDQRHSDDD